MKRIVDWRVFLTLLGMTLLSVFAVFPYVLTLQGEILKQINQPIHVIFLLQLIQSAVLFSICIFLGLLLSNKVSFQVPIIEAFFDKKDWRKRLKNVGPISLKLGVLTAIIIYAVDHLFTFMGAELSTSQGIAPIWQKLLAAFYGGITEEVLMRLFLMSLFVWIGTKITNRNKPNTIVIAVSIILTSVIFGLGHLPITASLTKITPIIVARAIVLNGIGGIVFGWLFWKKGLEAAMIAHFTTDIFLLTLLPLLIKG